MRNGDPWATGWAAAGALALLCIGLFLQLHVAGIRVSNAEPSLYPVSDIEPSQYELAYLLLDHAFDSVVVELDSVRATCQEVSP